jgi:hypothetical protein
MVQDDSVVYTVASDGVENCVRDANSGSRFTSGGLLMPQHEVVQCAKTMVMMRRDPVETEKLSWLGDAGGVRRSDDMVVHETVRVAPAT